MRRSGRSGGFTLLEVMVALAILAISLTAIAGISAGSYAASEYARDVTVATMLARSKMIDIEEELWDGDAFPSDDKDFSGDFEKEGHPDFKFEATARKIEVDVNQLVGGLLGGEVSKENLGDRVQEFIGAMRGEGPEDSNEQMEGSDLKQLLNGDMLEGMFKAVGETLKNAIREIELEISWGIEGRTHESIKFVQYIVTDSRINVPKGGLPARAKQLLDNAQRKPPQPGAGGAFDAAAGFPGAPRSPAARTPGTFGKK